MDEAMCTESVFNLLCVFFLVKRLLQINKGLYQLHLLDRVFMLVFV